MTQASPTSTAQPCLKARRRRADWSSDQRAFKNVPWGKAMMWIFLLSDTFIFSCFLISYMTVRMSTTEPWPNPSEVFALTLGGKSIPLILIAIMTFVLISSSGTMAMAVKFGYEKNKKMTFILLLITAALGATFVGMQAFEWTKLILEEGVRPWGNPMGAAQFGSSFFMITGFHGTHVSIGVIFLIIVAVKVLRGDLDHERPGFLTGRKGNYEIVETGSVLALRRFGVGIHFAFFILQGNHGTCTRATTSDRHLSQDLGLLFILSTASITLTTSTFRATRWSLVVIFMLLKAADRRLYAHGLGAAGLDVCHLVPPLLVLVLLGIGALEGNYTFFTRGAFFGAPAHAPAQHPAQHQ
jgi:cytochrome c oxidase subunit 3